MSTQFAAAIKSLAAKQQEKRATVPSPETSTPETDAPVKLKVKIEIVANRNRLDLFFNCIPPLPIREMLKSHDFRFDPKETKWYSYDSEPHRQMLRDEFKAQIDAYAPVNSPTTLAPIIVATAQPIVDEFAHPASSDKHCQQVIDLCRHFNISPGELMVRAIQLMHEETFI